MKKLSDVYSMPMAQMLSLPVDSNWVRCSLVAVAACVLTFMAHPLSADQLAPGVTFGDQSGISQSDLSGDDGSAAVAADPTDFSVGDTDDSTTSADFQSASSDDSSDSGGTSLSTGLTVGDSFFEQKDPVVGGTPVESSLLRTPEPGSAALFALAIGAAALRKSRSTAKKIA